MIGKVIRASWHVTHTSPSAVYSSWSMTSRAVPIYGGVGDSISYSRTPKKCVARSGGSEGPGPSRVCYVCGGLSDASFESGKVATRFTSSDGIYRSQYCFASIVFC